MTDPISLEEMGQQWGVLLSQAFAEIARLKKEIILLEQENASLRQNEVGYLVKIREMTEDKQRYTLSPAAKEIADRPIKIND